MTGSDEATQPRSDRGAGGRPATTHDQSRERERAVRARGAATKRSGRHEGREPEG